MVSAAFWLEKWQSGRIGFHNDAVNPLLVTYWPKLAASSRVLVPLCGKSKDLLWLAEQGYEVVGVELSSLAIDQFFVENHLVRRTVEVDGQIHHIAEGVTITLVEGDYFDFQQGEFDACYDRAALVALPKEIRDKYVGHTRDLLKEGAQLMVVTLYYDEERFQGPPFSIPDSEIQQSWPTLHKIISDDLLESSEAHRAKGYRFFYESVWRNSR